jgi:hypothetical protein
MLTDEDLVLQFHLYPENPLVQGSKSQYKEKIGHSCGVPNSERYSEEMD